MLSDDLPSSRKKTSVWPVAPFLIAAASVLTLMAENLNQTSFADIAGALIGTAAFAALVVAGVAALRRSLDAGTSVIASLWVTSAAFYTELYLSLNTALGGDYTMIRALLPVLLILAAITLGCQLLPRAMPALHLIVTGIGVALLAIPLQQSIRYAWVERGARDLYDPNRAMVGLPDVPAAYPAADARPPDIYHFVFDRLGSDDMLAREYGIETGLGEFLADQRFYIAAGSHSNYLKTGHSLASTFYMDYLDFLGDAPDLGGRNWHPIFEMLQDHRVGRILSELGYERIQFGSWWVGTFDNAFADENHPLGFSEFNMIYLRRTALRPFLHLLPPNGFTRRLDWDNAQCGRVPRQVEMIKALASDPRPAPIHVFAHILVPHGPYPFTADGKCLSRDEAAARGEDQGFVDQVAFAAQMIRDIVPALQNGSRGVPVILLQADEGPFPDRDYSVLWQEAPARELDIKTAILNAYFFPSGDYSRLTPDISPVNSYRVVFNTLFDAGLDPLPDRTFAFPNDSEIYEFHDVTDVLGKVSGASTRQPSLPTSGIIDPGYAN